MKPQIPQETLQFRYREDLKSAAGVSVCRFGSFADFV